MVVRNRGLLPVDRRTSEDIVIDLGAPRPDLSAPRLLNYTQRGGGIRPRVTTSAGSQYHNPLGRFENELNLGGSPSKPSKGHRRGSRRSSAFASPLYTPNPRLYQEPAPKKPAKAPRKASVSKRAKQRPPRNESPSRVTKRHKRKTRRIAPPLPNPRLYQAPPKRQRLNTNLPPQCPGTGWLPASDSAPQYTASQIALQFSERQKIPFKELLPATIKAPVVQLCTSQLAPHPTPRERIWEMVAGLHGSQVNSTQENKQLSKSHDRQLVREKAQKVKSRTTKNKKDLPKERPDAHTHFLPKTGSIGQVTPNIPTLDDIPHLTYAESSIPNLNIQDLAYAAPNLNATKRYQPQSQHFRERTFFSISNSSTSTEPPAARLRKAALLPEAEMAASPHSSITPEEVSDGNDSLSSAPSEYLAEFLSAIMSRNYAEALKYCRLILHYEPHNSTAQGFYPLLRYKLGISQTRLSHSPTSDGKAKGSSNSEGSSSEAGGLPRSGASPEGMEDLEKGSDSEAESVASLSLDSSGKSSRSASPAAHGTDSSASECSPEILGVTGVTATGATWLADDNGNPRSESKKHHQHGQVEDDENDNGPNGDHRLVLQESDIRQLRAQFACSIK